MEPNIPASVRARSLYSEEVSHIRTDVLADWEDGSVSQAPGGMSLDDWAAIVTELAAGLDLEPEIHLDPEKGLGFARVNRGFPLELIAYSPRALEWKNTQPHWAKEQSAWNELFRGNLGVSIT